MNTTFLIIVLALVHNAVDCTPANVNITEKLLNSSTISNETTTMNKTGPFLCPMPNNNNSEPSMYSGRTSYINFLQCIYSRSVINFIFYKDDIIKANANKNTTNQPIKILGGSSSEIPLQTEYDSNTKHISTKPSRSTTIN